VKDVLQLLKSVGLLLPTHEDSFPQDPFAPVFSEASLDAIGADGDELSSNQKMTEESEEIAALAEAVEDACGESGADGGGKPPSASEPTSAIDAGSKVGSTERGKAANDADVEPKAAERALSADDFAGCDPRVGLLEALSLISNVVSPGSEQQIRMSLDRNKPNSEVLSLLEYLETELIYAEFERVLMCLATVSTGRDKELCSRLPLARRLDGFFRHVLLPTLAGRAPVRREQPEAALAASANAAEDDAGAEEEAEAAAKDGDGAAEPAGADAAAPREVITLWGGFDASPDVRLEASRCPRAWPSLHERDVADW
jgi:hypothetical protein